MAQPCKHFDVNPLNSAMLDIEQRPYPPKHARKPKGENKKTTEIKLNEMK